MRLTLSLCDLRSWLHILLYSIAEAVGDLKSLHHELVVAKKHGAIKEPETPNEITSEGQKGRSEVRRPSLAILGARKPSDSPRMPFIAPPVPASTDGVDNASSDGDETESDFEDNIDELATALNNSKREPGYDSDGSDTIASLFSRGSQEDVDDDDESGSDEDDVPVEAANKAQNSLNESESKGVSNGRLGGGGSSGDDKAALETVLRPSQLVAGAKSVHPTSDEGASSEDDAEDDVEDYIRPGQEATAAPDSVQRQLSTQLPLPTVSATTTLAPSRVPFQSGEQPSSPTPSAREDPVSNLEEPAIPMRLERLRSQTMIFNTRIAKWVENPRSVKSRLWMLLEVPQSSREARMVQLSVILLSLLSILILFTQVGLFNDLS